MRWRSLSHVWLFSTPWTIQSIEFPRTEYWSGYPFPSPADLPNPGTEPRSPALQADSLSAEPQESPRILEWVAYPFPSGSSRPRNWTRVSALQARFFTNWAIREAFTWCNKRFPLIFNLPKATPAWIPNWIFHVSYEHNIYTSKKEPLLTSNKWWIQVFQFHWLFRENIHG